MVGLRHRGRRRTVAAFVTAERRRDSASALARYYTTPTAFDRRLPWHDASYLVLDVEATAVDPDEGHLLSMGWVRVERGAVVPDTARHHLVRPPTSVEVGQSAVVHHITDTEVSGGDDLDDVVDALFADLTGRVLVCHFAEIELGYIGKLCRRRWGVGFWPWQLVDTMQWHVDRSRRLLQVESARNVRLPSLLSRYGLPPVRNHHALSDAYGTALLLMAIGGGSSHDKPSGDGLGPTVRRVDDLLDQRSWTP